MCVVPSARCWALLAAATLLAALAPAHAARLALVVGIDNYQTAPKLENARADAQSMAAALRSAGFAVELQTDRTLKQLQSDVRAFRQRIAGGDEVVVFFSGHGLQLGGTNYLLPTDVSGDSEEQVRDDALALSKLLEDLRERKPRFTLAIIDACRDNPFTGHGSSIGGRGLTGVAGATGQMVIYAAGEGQRALDRLSDRDPVRNGVFTRVFVREMARPGASIRDVLYRVRDEVAMMAEAVRHEQVPAVYDQVRGNYYFMPPAPPPAPSLLPAVPLLPVTAPTSPPAAQAPATASTPTPPMEKVTLAMDAFFDSGVAALHPAASAKLLSLVEHIKGLNLEVLIAVGHADGNEADAQRLSVRRAELTKAQLVTEGVPANRIYTEGKGASQPVADNKTAEGRAKNRRVELEVVGTRARR